MSRWAPSKGGTNIKTFGGKALRVWSPACFFLRGSVCLSSVLPSSTNAGFLYPSKEDSVLHLPGFQCSIRMTDASRFMNGEATRFCRQPLSDYPDL